MSTLTFAINDNNDLYLDDSDNIAMHVDLLAVQDACLGACRTILGEMVFYINEGLPNFQAIWNGTPDLAQYDAALRATLLAVPDVLEVTSIELEQTGNILNYTVTILTTYGQAQIDANYSI